MGADTIITLCSQCYNTLARANQLVREDEEKRDTLNRFMDEEPDYDGTSAGSYDEYLNNTKFVQLNTGLQFRQNFSEYVSISALFNYYLRRYDYDFFGVSKKVDQKKYEYGGAFELIF